MFGPSRWIVIAATSPSGKTLFVCQCCGQISPAPDKECSAQPTYGTRFLLPGRCHEWEQRELATDDDVTDATVFKARAAVRAADSIFETLDEEMK